MNRLGILEVAVDRSSIFIGKENDNNFDVALHQSVIAGDIFEVSMLLQLGADPNSKGTQLLKLFKDANHKDAIRLLPYIENLKQLRDEVTIISLFDIYQVEATLLHMASWNGWLDVTGDLITKYGCDQQERDTKGNTCLHYAAMGNHVSVIDYLIIEYSSDPTVTNENGDTILHKAAYYGSLDVIKYLINHRCNPKSTNRKKGETLLHCAVEHVDILKYLIDDEGSCNPMATTFDGRTPLHYAANFGCPASVEFLLSTGKCDPLAEDKDGKTPLQLAKERQQRDGTNTLPIFKKFGGIKLPHPIDSYVKVLLVGNPGAGKSTLAHVINGTATGPFVLGSFRNVVGVVPCTAGVIPYKLQHRTLGNIILHDFAGHSEYYS
uniref:Uncharacterized protein n=1 Tax=Amphimedon queenslandica TaxID=400682 RepID=A0A1X7SP01_AMPQE